MDQSQSSLEKFIEEETEKFISKWRNNGRPDVNDENFQKFVEEEMNETIMRYKMAKRLQEELSKENAEEKWRKSPESKHVHEWYQHGSEHDDFCVCSSMWLIFNG